MSVTHRRGDFFLSRCCITNKTHDGSEIRVPIVSRFRPTKTTLHMPLSGETDGHAIVCPRPWVPSTRIRYTPSDTPRRQLSRMLFPANSTGLLNCDHVKAFIRPHSFVNNGAWIQLSTSRTPTMRSRHGREMLSGTFWVTNYWFPTGPSLQRRIEARVRPL
jgi:hypothetical protein